MRSSRRSRKMPRRTPKRTRTSRKTRVRKSRATRARSRRKHRTKRRVMRGGSGSDANPLNQRLEGEWNIIGEYNCKKKPVRRGMGRERKRRFVLLKRGDEFKMEYYDDTEQMGSFPFDINSFETNVRKKEVTLRGVDGTLTIKPIIQRDDDHDFQKLIRDLNNLKEAHKVVRSVKVAEYEKTNAELLTEATRLLENGEYTMALKKCDQIVSSSDYTGDEYNMGTFEAVQSLKDLINKQMKTNELEMKEKKKLDKNFGQYKSEDGGEYYGVLEDGKTELGYPLENLFVWKSNGDGTGKFVEYPQKLNSINSEMLKQIVARERGYRKTIGSKFTFFDQSGQKFVWNDNLEGGGSFKEGSDSLYYDQPNKDVVFPGYVEKRE